MVFLDVGIRNVQNMLYIVDIQVKLWTYPNLFFQPSVFNELYLEKNINSKYFVQQNSKHGFTFLPLRS